ncbi:hypothetical protein EDD21DRAFT_310905 [Dissophora ornata]|nr:hypothetical protein EDD21DRAFT_310905 [Dissophora ornata]
MDKLSAPRALFPVVNTRDLYVRQAYKDLYDEVSLKFQDSPGNSPENWTRKHVVVTGTSGIGKSAFLVYFTIRLLTTGSDDDPSIVVFQEEGSSNCYAYGGLSTVRYGDIEDFRPFLDLPETWYLVDSSPNPRLENARTIISASPKTLFSEWNQYQEVDKRVPWRYYMAPWTLDELKHCRHSVKGFHIVPEDIVEELYGKIGGVPRYVLEKPKDVLNFDPSGTDDAKKNAMMQCFEQGKESLRHSSRLLHRWPTDDHGDFHLEWASAYIADEIGKSLQDVAWQQILDKLVGVNVGAAKGPMFKLYVRHIFRKGGYDFQIRDLRDKTDATLNIPANPDTVLFKEISAVPLGTLCIPQNCNYACVDLLLSPKHLFQVTVSKNHDIKGPPFVKLLEDFKINGWVQSSGEAHLVFVVPSKIYDDFPIQNYLKSTGGVYTRIPPQMKQFVLKIDLDSASTGKSPGLRGQAY